PLARGPAVAEGRWISGQRRMLIADARLLDESGEEVARGTGTFMRSRMSLASLPGYRV
ncbi:MAG: thioesterase, partial [Sphingomonas hengshuiensis]